MYASAGMPGSPMVFNKVSQVPGQSLSAAPAPVRKEFPESWIWEEVNKYEDSFVPGFLCEGYIRISSYF